MSIADCRYCPKGFVNDCLTRVDVITIKSYHVFYSNRRNSEWLINFMTYAQYFKFAMGLVCMSEYTQFLRGGPSHGDDDGEMESV